ncbi:hypothetical protein CDAR_619491 [Caerostris darwini]|uniref:Uncharacterized protein n=1 Tax=Caerostris darwini TaxID=1538125 RepID=A0AAV4TS27_9ARAC|nr:hypothetical protein CDAR_619491 [Caerostris darwini]
MQDILTPSSPYSSFKHSLKLRISYHQNHGGVKVPQMSLHKAIAGPKSRFPSKPGKKRTGGSKGQSVFRETANGTPHPTQGMQDILTPSSPYSSFKHSLKLRISHHHNHGEVEVPQMSLHKAIAGHKSHFQSKSGEEKGSKGQSVFRATANGTPHPTRGNDG